MFIFYPQRTLNGTAIINQPIIYKIVFSQDTKILYIRNKVRLDLSTHVYIYWTQLQITIILFSVFQLRGFLKIVWKTMDLGPRVSTRNFVKREISRHVITYYRKKFICTNILDLFDISRKRTQFHKHFHVKVETWFYVNPFFSLFILVAFIPISTFETLN